MFDLVIHGSRVIDGSGCEPHRLDVGVIDGAIVDTGARPVRLLRRR